MPHKAPWIIRLKASWRFVSKILRRGRGPTKEREHLDRAVLSDEEVERIAAAAYAVFSPSYAPVMNALVWLSASAGLRMGEVLGMRWSSIDASYLHVDKQVDRRGLETAPKGGRSRVVLLAPEALATLDRFPPASDHEFVFYAQGGQPLSRGTLHRNFDQMRRAAGLGEVCFHDLRRYCRGQL